MSIRFAVFLAVVCVLATEALGQKPVLGLTNDEKIATQCKNHPQLRNAVTQGWTIQGAVSDLDDCKIDCLTIDKNGKKAKIPNLLRDDFDACTDGQGCLKGNCIKKNEDALKACQSLYNGKTMIAEPDSTSDNNCKAKCTIKDVDASKTCGKPNYSEGAACNTKSASGFNCQSGQCSNKPTTAATTTTVKTD